MLEALANSCCILALNTVFNAEMLMDGEHGLFFELNSKDLIAKINFIESHPEIVNTFRAKSVYRIKTYYNWEMVTARYLQLLKDLDTSS
jgi:glycosyltransferase involved in cell wall biosynthesis